MLSFVTDAYLKAQFVFCREEATFALRQAISIVKNMPMVNEPDLRRECSGLGIYDKVRQSWPSTVTYFLGG